MLVENGGTGYVEALANEGEAARRWKVEVQRGLRSRRKGSGGLVCTKRRQTACKVDDFAQELVRKGREAADAAGGARLGLEFCR